MVTFLISAISVFLFLFAFCIFFPICYHLHDNKVKSKTTRFLKRRTKPSLGARWAPLRVFCVQALKAVGNNLLDCLNA